MEEQTAELQSAPALVSMTIQVTRAATGQTETYELVTVEPEEKEED